jgi:hypothetical protein
LALAIIGGFLTKLSFILCVAALAIDWSWGRFSLTRVNWGKIIKRAVVIVPWFLILAGGIYWFFSTNFATVITYAGHFKIFNCSERAYGDMGFKIIKSLLLASPLLLFSGLLAFTDGKLRRQYRFWWIYTGINIVFYLLIFDFTRLTIERYLMFMIAPLCIVGAEVVYKMVYSLQFTVYGLKQISGRRWLAIGVGAYLLMLILIIPHDVIPLNPKSAYFDRITLGELNFLIRSEGASCRERVSSPV